MNQDIKAYNQGLGQEDEEICNKLALIIDKTLTGAESKIWHAHPVWFLDGNPIVGYSRQKKGLRLMFWSGAGFKEDGLDTKGGKFKDASVFYRSASEINESKLMQWLEESKTIQWDYKNIVKRKGRLERLN